MQIWVKHNIVDGIHLFTAPMGSLVAQLCAASHDEKEARLEMRRQCLKLLRASDHAVIDQNMIIRELP